MSETFALFLTLTETNVGISGRDQGWRIEIHATVKVGFTDAAVFRYQKISAEEVLFTGVCSPADIADYGLSPRGDDGFFRADALKLDFAARSTAYEIRDAIFAEVETLCDEMARLANSVTPPQTIEVSSDPSTNSDPQ